MQRPIIGVIAVVLLLAGLGLTLFSPDAESNAEWKAASWRIGAILAAVWLAYPELDRLPRWIFAAILITALVVARWRQLVPLVIAVLVVIAILCPRSRAANLHRPAD